MCVLCIIGLEYHVKARILASNEQRFPLQRPAPGLIAPHPAGQERKGGLQPMSLRDTVIW